MRSLFYTRSVTYGGRACGDLNFFIVHSNPCFAVPLLKEISLNGGRACGDLDFFIILIQSLVHCLCAINQMISECKVPIFMSYHPSIVSKILQMGLFVHLFIQTHVIWF